MMWRLLHIGVAFHWGMLLVLTVFEIATTGELNRVADVSPRFSTATALYFVLLAFATSASAIRGWWREYDA